jgi:hypothetical protein
MSRLYFHSPSGTAELHGSEREWFGHIVRGVASAAWAIDDSATRLAQVERIIGLIPEASSTDFRRDLRAARAARASCLYGSDIRAELRLNSTLKTYLQGYGTLRVAGRDLSARDVARNTALVAGSPAVQLAAKLDGYGEMHCWVDGPDRAWLAGVVEQGLDVGIFRRGFWFAPRPCDSDPAAQPDRQWSDQGWDGVIAHLRSRSDEPVVCSYSICDPFPNRDAAEAGGWRPTPLPDGWVPDWAVTDGRNEWDAMPPDHQADYRDEAFSEQWGSMTDAEQWRTAMDGLRTKPWLQITPGSLGRQLFGPPVTVYDLLAPDRDERVLAAFADPPEPATAADTGPAVQEAGQGKSVLDGFYLLGDEDGGVGLYCRTCAHAGRPVAYDDHGGVPYGLVEGGPDVDDASTIAELLQAAVDHRIHYRYNRAAGTFEIIEGT